MTVVKNFLPVLQTHNIPFFFVCNDPLWGIGLEKQLSHYHIVCIDDKEVVTLLKQQGIPVFCLEQERQGKNIIFRNTVKLLQQQEVAQYIHKQGKGKLPAIIPFKPQAAIAHYCEQRGYRLLAADYALNLHFEDKLSFAHFLAKQQLPGIPCTIKTLKQQHFSYLCKLLGLPFVVQFGHGFAGTSTYLINHKADYDDLVEQYPDKKAKISRYIEGITFTINACATRFGTVLSPFCFQITGYKQYTTSWGGTCGTTWQFPRVPRAIEKQLYHLTATIGTLMYQMGFKGIFGLDFVVDKEFEKIYIVENNARIVASIPLFTKMQLCVSQVPLLALHLCELLNLEYIVNLQEINEQNLVSFKASQLIMRNTTGCVKSAVEIPRTGIYQWQKKQLVFKKSAYSFEDLQGKNDVLVIPVGRGQKVNPGIEYVRFQTQRDVLDSHWQLQPWVHEVAALLSGDMLPTV